ncbi:preprotein translocase subunit SecD [Halorarum halophilum]|uniref:Protein-export membrane protein SecD n=1 Tax=Halorarum halophilum TaxID=2743090 RepID=A0A7D5H2Z2_9EURY|nr:preprotein translocase subunit SecD [Halobaculum halophilum]QLG29473.1 preprotein translocase subunit SecD [Halobaculum halophilum]
MSSMRDNWRVVLLVVVLLLSTVFLFAPGFGNQGPSAPDTATNLKYGLDLSGGTRVRAPVVGITAQEVEIGNESLADVERSVAANLDGTDANDVIARQTGPTTGTVEVVDRNVTTDELSTALDQAGYAHGDVTDGVTDTTLQETVRVLESKINEAGLSGGSVTTTTTTGGEDFVLVQVPNQDRSDVLELVSSRGSVSIVAYHPSENGSGYTNTTVIRQEDFQRIGGAQQGEQGPGPHVQVAVKDGEAQRVQQSFVDTGVAQQGGTTCTYESNPGNTQPCILVVRDGNVVSSFGMDPGLAQSMRSGEWAENPTFILVTGNFSDAQQVAVDLRAGALPAPLAVDQGTTTSITATQGETFRTDSLIIGIIAVLTVSVVVFLRYGDPQVAAPMVVTAMSEVYALLGFAALIQYPLDLAVIAGFIAVIGTGVDDLVIIADEVMSEGDVNSRRVFQSRFRKAFWVIGAAAATTIVAMSPLAVLSLGDLQGFAIFTILGVLVGVLITRPAYGDILRVLLTER